MNLVEEKQRGLIPPGLQSWPLELIEDLANTTSVAPPPAGPVGCCPLYLLHLLNLSFTIWAPNRCCILQFRAYQRFVCNLLGPGRVAQSVTCLATDACLTADPGVASSIPARSHTFVEIDHEIISTVILLLPLIYSRRVVVSYKRKYVHKLLVNRLFKPAQEKVWLGELTVPQ